jgi:hypothetical protein
MNTRFNNQRGVALIVGLIFLIILTLFVLGSLRDVLLQERMSGAYRNQSLSQSVGDSLVRDAQARIFSNVVTSGRATNPSYFTLLDTETAVSPNPVLRDFRSGSGYIAGGLNPVNVFNPVNLESKLSQPGGYVIEGPFKVTADGGLRGGSGSRSGLGLETHTISSGGVAGGSSGSGSGGGGVGGGAGGESIFGYRITARAAGGTDDFITAVEAYYTIVL